LPLATQEQTPLVEQTTPGFRLDWERLSPTDRAAVRQALDRGYAVLRDNRRAFFAKVRRPPSIQLKSGFTSSLYSLRAGRDIRVIIAVDDDPVFGQTLITLFRVVPQDELERSFRSIARVLYGNQIHRANGAR